MRRAVAGAGWSAWSAPFLSAGLDWGPPQQDVRAAGLLVQPLPEPLDRFFGVQRKRGRDVPRPEPRRPAFVGLVADVVLEHLCYLLPDRGPPRSQATSRKSPASASVSPASGW